MVEVKKSKNVISYAKACEEKRIELLFIPKGYQREQGRERQVQGEKVEERIVLV